MQTTMAATNPTKACFILLAFFSSLFLAAVAIPSENLKALATVEKVNRLGPYLGLISARPITVLPIGFKRDRLHPYVVLSGRLFLIGEQEGRRVILVGSGTGLVNAAATTQLMLDVFNVYGIVHFGVAGSADGSLSIGDVVIPTRFAQTGLWDWQNPNVTSNDAVELEFASYTVPSNPNGYNRLGSVGYRREEFYSQSGHVNTPKKTLWFPVERSWHQIASALENIELLQCVSENVCLPERPKVVLGTRGSTSNFFINNEAYRDFLFNTFGVASVDMESAAVVMTSLSNGYPVIVVRGLSNLAGAPNDELSEKLGSLAARNAAIVVYELVNILGSRPYNMFESNLKLHGNN